MRLGVDASRSTVDFGDLDDRLWTIGGNVVLDTRGDPAFPGNAVLLGGRMVGAERASTATASTVTPPTRAATSASSASP